jgi:phage terminase small subunit
VARKRKDDSALVLVGGKKPQMREASKSSWTNAKEAEFLAVLADTCNVTQAAAEAGVSSSAAYKRRKENAAFRAAWLEAISVAYQRLELVLLERAFNGTEKLVKRRDGSEERMLEYSNQLGLTLLKMHRDTAVEASIEMAPDQIEELRERLFNKFKRLKQRDQSGDESA